MQTTLVTCPECGATTHITSGRRDASDFCAACDFPLFWAGTAVEVRDDPLDTDDALRRLPGTEGRGLSYSVPCPTCGELNLATAVLCLRCTCSMTPPPPPAPAPVPMPVPVVPEPEPEPEPEAPSRWRWWVLAAAAIVLTTVVVLVVRLA